jgi:hypothetical protein
MDGGITDDELAALPAQRKPALQLFADRHQPSHAVLGWQRDHDQYVHRLLTRAFIARARRQEALPTYTPR